jgi:hypothetical protein
MHVDPAGDLLGAAEACEAEVFLRAYGNTAEEWADEYGPYDQSSVFLAMADPDGDVVAACRLIVPGPAGLKTLNDTSRAPWHVEGYRAARSAGIDPDATIDIATIGVRRGLRGAGMLASVALYHGIVQLTRANAMPDVVMLMDERARRLLTSIGCLTFALPGTAPGPYLGSAASTPLWANVPQMMDHQRRTNPDAFRLVSQGIGLDGIDVPALDQFRLDRNQQPAEAAPNAVPEAIMEQVRG